MINPVQKVCKGFSVRFTQEDKPGIRGQVKRFFPETIEVEVHQRIPLLLSRDKKEREIEKWFIPLLIYTIKDDRGKYGKVCI
jgi:hypothetical protein